VGALTAACKLQSDFHQNWLTYIMPHAAYKPAVVHQHLSFTKYLLSSTYLVDST